jgi:transcriptional regulator with XRE-family HTH domain
MQYAYELSIKDILQELVSKVGISEAELARKIKIPIATFNKIKNGKITDPRSSTLKIIANYFGLTVDQLLGYAPITTNIDSTILYVPVLSLENIIKTDTSKLTYANHKDWVSFNPQLQIANHKIIAIQTNGEAMLPFFDNDTLAIVDCEQIGQSNQYVLAYIKSRDEIILRQLLCDGNFRVLKPLNSSFSIINLTDEDRVLGVVVHSIRSFK